MQSRVARVSIVVVDYAGQSFWPPLVRSLANQTFADFEVIIVDNAGDLSIADETLGVKIRLIVSESNLGYAEGCNLGLRCASGDLVVFLNNDTIVDSEWLENLKCRMETDPAIAAVVSKVLFYPKYVQMEIETPVFAPVDIGPSNDMRELGVRMRFDPSWNESSGLLNMAGFHGKEGEDGDEWRWTRQNADACIPLSDIEEHNRLVLDTTAENGSFTAKLFLGGKEVSILNGGKRHVIGFTTTSSNDVINSAGSELDEKGECLETGIYEIDRGQYDDPREVTAFSGCSVMVRREAFEKLGGFDPAFFAYYEDTDLSWRMRKAGWKIMYEPKSVVRHHRSSTSGEQTPFFCYHIYRNKHWNIAKNARIGTALLSLARECFCWIPKLVNTNAEYSRWRLKRQTVLGMLRYLLKRAFQKIG